MIDLREKADHKDPVGREGNASNVRFGEKEKSKAENVSYWGPNGPIR
jgi:hypothetical protein